MGLKCHCGSTDFSPLGIQESYSTSQKRDDYRVIFLVNCLQCGTTLATNRLDYALRRSEQTEEALVMPFYTE